jgi:hypothetical protein
MPCIDARYRDAAPGEHAKAVVELHAHVKAADRYLEKACRRASVPLASDDDAAEAEALADPETRAIRQVPRATAAVILNASGNQAAAKRLLPTSLRTSRGSNGGDSSRPGGVSRDLKVATMTAAIL